MTRKGGPLFNEKMTQFGDVTWRSASRHFHVQLNRVHAEDRVADMTQDVARRHDACKRRQLGQLMQLFLPPTWTNQKSSFFRVLVYIK